MRYGIALIIAVILIAAGAFYVRHVERSVEQRVRQSLREAKAQGGLPPDIDPEQADLTSFGVDLPATELSRVQLAHFLVAWRLVLIPTVLLMSLGIARIVGSKRPQSK
jgi:hypothetical protein